jgi:hypothetical protein
MTTIGTSYFVSHAAAVRYYREYEPGMTREHVRRIVDHKVADGSIHIGKPELKPHQKLSLIDNGTRYAITEE